MKQLMQTQLTTIYIYTTSVIVVKNKTLWISFGLHEQSNKVSIYIGTICSKTVTYKTLWAFSRVDRQGDELEVFRSYVKMLF